MSEQSLRERLHSTHTLAGSGRPRGMLIAGAAFGAIAAAVLATSFGAPWGVPGLILTAACLWGFFARGANA